MSTAVVRGAAVLFALVCARPAAALVIGGGGAPTKDCLVALDVDANFPYEAPNQVRCVDGDTACDADMTVNGSCSLRVKVCANSTYSAACTANGVAQINVDHATDNGNDPKFDPDFLAIRQRIASDFTFPVTQADKCTSTVIVTVPIKGPLGSGHCSRRRKKLKLHSVSQPASGSLTDTDTLKLSCLPAPLNGCDPHTLYASTFDRIQKQIFNQSCALGGCHDSQTQSGGLLLETGASYDNLVGQIPTKVAAQNAGWLRVRVVTPDVYGDLPTSFLFHKLEGDFPDGDFGDRMPKDKAKISATLRDIIERWIKAGAPKTLWVPGTF